MEISKEREAFELQEHIKPYLNSVVFDQRNNKYKSEDICEPICNHSARVVNSGWLSWQAAKATPEGFVLVPRKATKAIILEIASVCIESRDPYYGVDYLSLEDAEQVYEAIIEAQEQK
ncbi:hypothetical protein [Acinetobacter bereziniae]|uniref:hypothetical protein n=1 Tax=Acinetobacter bereziniae TaxID=106648 RepID=UPI0018FF5143|nr:hypothetical protein [Acinetobacter bereziniae]MBJ9902034.1 hypothetical protein [Acinetobacter bereziniae]MCU4317943.1 hypothetical protein [Acinetobacter bereziniae]MCU4597756.1 hypothetical protein [Acinetobacter bereziniae]